MRRFALTWLVALLAIALLSGCGARRKAPAGDTVAITVIGTEYAFEPRDVSVTEGDQVKLTFRNDGAIAHTWEVPAFNVISNELATGESQELTFVADKPGTFEILCGVVGHADLGMVGTLTVNKR